VDYTNQSTGAKTTVASGSSSGRGAVIIAGIYSGKLIPELRGKLIFADSGSGEVFAAADRGTNPWPLQSVMRITSGVISALGFNSDGELFIGTESGEILAVYAN
jgi:hypothetical protein